MTPSGIEPATFRFVAQQLNHCATAVPKQVSDNEIYLLIKYTKIVLWRVVKRLSYIEDARCLKVNQSFNKCASVGERTV